MEEICSLEVRKLKLTELENRVVLMHQYNHSYLCDLTRLLTDPECFGDVVQEFVEGFERFEQAHQERYLSKIISLGRMGLVVGSSVAALSRRPLVALGGDHNPLSKPDDWRRIYWSGNTQHWLQMPRVVDVSDAVLLVADILLSGQTLLAATELVAATGAEVVGIFTLVEVPELGGRARLQHAGHEVQSVLKVPLVRT